MNQNKHFEMRYKKLTGEAILKSLFCGLLISFGAIFVLGAVFWIIGTRNLGLVIGLLCGVFALVTGGMTALFYFIKFKPTVTSNARRIDKLGLEERVITMIEFQDDDSVMANLQRNDAIQALTEVDKKAIHFQFSNKLIVALSITAAVSLTMSTISTLNAAGLLPSVTDLIIQSQEHPEYVPVSYFAEDGGYIEGESEQLVLFGENATPVEAIAEEGYSFEGWDDGQRKPSRTDKEVDHPLVLTAIFVPLDEDGEDPGDEGEYGENGEAPGEQEGNSDSPGNSGDNPGDETGGSGGTPQSKDKNFIIDGTEENDYKLHLPQAKDEIMEFLKANLDKLTEEERAIIEAYINIL